MIYNKKVPSAIDYFLFTPGTFDWDTFPVKIPRNYCPQ